MNTKRIALCVWKRSRMTPQAYISTSWMGDPVHLSNIYSEWMQVQILWWTVAPMNRWPAWHTQSKWQKLKLFGYWKFAFAQVIFHFLIMMSYQAFSNKCFPEWSPNILKYRYVLPKQLTWYRIGLGPYFIQKLTHDVKSSGTTYTAEYDETATSQGKTQMDVLLRYWSDKKGSVVVAFGVAIYSCMPQLSRFLLNCCQFWKKWVSSEKN